VTKVYSLESHSDGKRGKIRQERTYVLSSSGVIVIIIISILLGIAENLQDLCGHIESDVAASIKSNLKTAKIQASVCDGSAAMKKFAWNVDALSALSMASCTCERETLAEGRGNSSDLRVPVRIV
jgi:hypothetical protein